MSGDIITFPTDTAVSADEYVATEKVSGNVVFRQKTKPEDLKVRPTGSQTARTLAAVAADVTVTTAGTVEASKAVVVDANKDITGFRHVTFTGNLVTGSTTLSEAELGVLDSAGQANSAASKAAILDTNKRLRTNASVGTANTGSTAVEYGDGRLHQTVLTLATTLPAIAGGASLGVGKLLYTFPAGAIIVESAYMSVAITQTEGNITADTPDVGLGTVIASGAIATLDGTGTFENIITGQTAADCNGTATVKTAIPTANVPFVIEAGAAHTIYLNVADGWAASGDAAAAVAGTVVLNWRFMA